ncbi:hypothetical protein KUTeg_002832 [Tegillarca granosa]|uniref:Uncharacterized protein n=1 Tax=Tegillarca granosa TaxID=220873 RepID=A0ABQ9FTJ7_TEGGR|nr:hypothetical protein KUTeg_002832 [Tegillarca granosa]
MLNQNVQTFVTPHAFTSRGRDRGRTHRGRARDRSRGISRGCENRLRVVRTAYVIIHTVACTKPRKRDILLEFVGNVSREVQRVNFVGSKTPKVSVKNNGLECKFLVDTSASVNILNEATHPTAIKYCEKTHFVPYGGGHKINVLGVKTDTK